MSGRQQTSTGSGQGSTNWSQSGVLRSVSESQDPRQAAFTRLRECIPQDEDQWREARERHGFSTPEEIHAKVSAIIKDDPSLPEDLRKFLHLASCCVGRYCGDEAKYSKYRGRVHNEHLSELTIDRNMSVVQDIISSMDELYPILQHRVFEIMLLYAPLKISLLKYFRQDKDRFKSCFPTSTIVSEEQAYFPLSPPDLIVLRYPQQYTYEQAHGALNVGALSKSEHLRLAEALENRKTLSRVPPDSHSVRKGLYNTVLDVWFDGDVNLLEYLNTEVIFTIPNRITSYKVFDIPEGIQKEAALAGEDQDNCVRQPDMRSAVLFRFRWSPRLSIVIKHIYSKLVKSNILSPGLAHGNQFYFRHESGAMRVPNGWLCILVPTIPTTEKVTITLTYGAVKEDITWCNSSGLLLGPGTTLSIPSRVYYIWISLPLDPD